MRALIQVVNKASVSVLGQEVGAIKRGFLVFLAISKNDSEDLVLKMAEKILKLRILADENGKINLSLSEVQGEILLVSQFTLYADCRKGNRPSFANSASAEKADQYYQKIINILSSQKIKVATGSFGKHMKVQLENDGPTTVIIDLDS